MAKRLKPFNELTEIEKVMRLSNKNGKELAEILNVNYSTISRYKNGSRRLRLDDLKKLCELLEVDIKEVL